MAELLMGLKSSRFGLLLDFVCLFVRGVRPYRTIPLGAKLGFSWIINRKMLQNNKIIKDEFKMLIHIGRYILSREIFSYGNPALKLYQNFGGCQYDPLLWMLLVSLKKKKKLINYDINIVMISSCDVFNLW